MTPLPSVILVATRQFRDVVMQVAAAAARMRQVLPEVIHSAGQLAAMAAQVRHPISQDRRLYTPAAAAAVTSRVEVHAAWVVSAAAETAEPTLLIQRLERMGLAAAAVAVVFKALRMPKVDAVVMAL
jgi:hypothetical protein